jgi:peptidoglycan hydrolase-like protein with peptidoglycan-binding domain
MPLKFPRQSPHAVRQRSNARGAAGLAAAVGAGVLMTAAPASAHVSQITDLLAVGAQGSQVSQVQQALHLKRTGHYGSRTRQAVTRFQAKNHLLVDGVVGPQTWDKLFHIHYTPPAGTTPAPAAATTPTTTSSYASSGYSGYSIPSSIVQCESGGNWGAVNASSGAGGAYQILPSTWAAYGGTGLPQDASPAEQSAVAAKIYAASGGSAWSCG